MRRYVILLLLAIPFVLSQSCDNSCSDYDCWLVATTRSIACSDSDTQLIEKQNWYAPCMLSELDNLTKVSSCCAWDLNWSFFEYQDCDENQSCLDGSCRECNTVSNDVCDSLCAAIDPDCTDLDDDGHPSVSDCDDSEPSIYPGAPEICDGNDNNCDDIIPSNERDLDKDGHFACTDCNDYNKNVYPKNKNRNCACPSNIKNEICDNKVDDDCDGSIDDLDIECSDIFDQAFNTGSALIAKAEIEENATEQTAIQFFDKSVGGDITFRLWDFGDGATSNLKNPTHTYPSPGKFNVVLTVSDAKGKTDSNAIVVDIGCKGNCSSNKDCNDDNDLTVDVCALVNTCNAHCEFLNCKPKCVSDAECDDGNNNTDDICVNVGSCNSFCKHPPSNFDFTIVSPVADTYYTYEIELNVSVVPEAKCTYQLNKGNIVPIHDKVAEIDPRPKDNTLLVKCSLLGLTLEKEVKFYVTFEKPKENVFKRFWGWIKDRFTKKRLKTDISDEDTGSVLKEAFGVDEIDEEKINQSKETKESSEMEKTAEKNENGTTVNINFKPEKVMKNVTIYEKVPKSVAESAKDIDFNDPNVEIIEDDPLFVWHFEEVKTEVDLSYTVEGEIDDEVPVTVPVAEEFGPVITNQMTNEITGAAVSSGSLAKVIIPLAAIPVIGLLLVVFNKISKRHSHVSEKAPFEESTTKVEEQLTTYIINHVVLGEDQDEIRQRLLKEGKDPMIIRKVFDELESEI